MATQAGLKGISTEQQFSVIRASVCDISAVGSASPASSSQKVGGEEGWEGPEADDYLIHLITPRSQAASFAARPDFRLGESEMGQEMRGPRRPEMNHLIRWFCRCRPMLAAVAPRQCHGVGHKSEYSPMKTNFSRPCQHPRPSLVYGQPST